MSVSAPKPELLTPGSPAGSVGAIHTQLSQGYQALAKAHAAMAGQTKAANTTALPGATVRLAGALANKTTTNDPGGSTV